MVIEATQDNLKCPEIKPRPENLHRELDFNLFF